MLRLSMQIAACYGGRGHALALLLHHMMQSLNAVQKYKSSVYLYRMFSFCLRSISYYLGFLIYFF